ncbi:hypothetical protein, partial [Aquabacterium sp.]|uniref:hypothetical protein n=1 Tax=Aquabacterium sp. TaxID=1872578 RepID=UPI003D6DA7B6
MIHFSISRFCVILLIPLVGVSIGGCGEAYPDEAQTYTAAAEVSLIAQGICANTQDCAKREVLFWEGGNLWIPSLKKVFVNIYGVKDPASVEAVARSIVESKSSTGGPPCLL